MGRGAPSGRAVTVPVPTRQAGVVEVVWRTTTSLTDESVHSHAGRAHQGEQHTARRQDVVVVSLVRYSGLTALAAGAGAASVQLCLPAAGVRSPPRGCARRRRGALAAAGLRPPPPGCARSAGA